MDRVLAVCPHFRVCLRSDPHSSKTRQQPSAASGLIRASNLGLFISSIIGLGRAAANQTSSTLLDDRRHTRNRSESVVSLKLPCCNCHSLPIPSRAMKDKILIVFALAVGIPMLFGNFWFVAVTGSIVEATVNPLLDMFLDSIGPD